MLLIRSCGLTTRVTSTHHSVKRSLDEAVIDRNDEGGEIQDENLFADNPSDTKVSAAG